MQLGDTVKHKITGFEGVTTGRAEYLTGCTQWLVTSRTLKPDGDSQSQWLDEIMLMPQDVPNVGIGIPANQPGGPPMGPMTTVQAPPRR